MQDRAFKKRQIALVLLARAILYIFKKTHSCMFFSRNHTITYTNGFTTIKISPIDQPNTYIINFYFIEMSAIQISLDI